MELSVHPSLENISTNFEELIELSVLRPGQDLDLWSRTLLVLVPGLPFSVGCPSQERVIAAMVT